MIRAEPDSDKQLKSIVERIERLLEECDSIKGDVRDVYAEAKSNGFDKTVLGQVVAIRRKRSKDPTKFEEVNALVRIYLDRIEGVGTPNATHTHTHAREEAAPPKPKLVAVDAPSTPAPAPAPKPALVMPDIPAFLDRRGGSAA